MKHGLNKSTAAITVCAVAAILLVTALAQDPTKVNPQIYKTILENERVRVNEIHFTPGQHIDWHQHPDHVIYWTQAGTVRIYNKGADSVDVTGTVGQAMYLSACTHAATNIGKTDIRLVQVELKEPAPAKPAAGDKK